MEEGEEERDNNGETPRRWQNNINAILCIRNDRRRGGREGKVGRE